MASCKDCLHVDVCCSYLSTVYNKCKLATPDFEPLKNIECDECQHFKDRSRFVELPCKLGNSVFSLNPNRTFHAIRVDGANVELITSQGFIFNQSLIGKTVFLTREEAERALKERET